jgi:hypothetical protein
LEAFEESQKVRGRAPISRSRPRPRARDPVQYKEGKFVVEKVKLARDGW